MVWARRDGTARKRMQLCGGDIVRCAVLIARVEKGKRGERPISGPVCRPVVEGPWTLLTLARHGLLWWLKR
jgi:hypothetical protein